MYQIYFILEWHSTCFGWSFRPSSGVRRLYIQLYLFDSCIDSLGTPEDGRKDRPKHVVSFQNKINLIHWCVQLVLL